MLSEETLRTQAATTFPLNALQMDGKTIGLVHDCACSVLPFSSTAYTANVVNSLEEAAPFLDTKNVTREAPVKWCAHVTFSVAASSPRHGLLLRNLSTTASSSHLLSAAGDKGLGDLERALAKVAEDKSLWGFSASSSSSAPACTSLQVYLMSEPVVPESISSTLNDLPAASSMSRGGATMTTTRVVLGNSPSDIIAALRDLATALLTDNAKDFTDTEVCWPRELAFPVNVHTSDDARRRTEHAALLLPNKGLLHHRDAVSSWLTYEDLLRQRPSGAAQFRTGEAWEKHLVTNPHTELPSNAAPALAGAETLLTSGAYDYYHYRVDGFKDDGWGCAYRSLQTVLSWFQHAGQMAAPVPSLRRIQEILSAVDPDKANKKQFVGSCDWIGSFEIMLVLQHYMPGLDCTIRRMESGKDLETDPSVQMLLSEHFRHPNASPVMIGGSSYAHTILGIHVNVNTMEVRYLILDPHYTANPTQIKTAIKKGYVGWKEASSFFEAASWYNLCIPRTDTYDPR